MPSHPPRSLESYSQKASLEKRVKQLRRAIERMAPADKLRDAAESVRSAQLLVLKAELELIRYADVAHDRRWRAVERTKRIGNLQRLRDHWESITVEAILMQYVD